MKRATVKDVACPAMTAAGMCKGGLELSSDIPVVEAPNPAHGILEAILACARCGARYPVLFGIPVLIGETRSFLRANYGSFFRFSAELNIPLSSAMQAYLRRQYAHMQTPDGSASAFHGNEQHLSQYVAGHYDNLLDTLPATHPLREFLRKYYEKDLYSTFIEAIPFPEKPLERGLDIGCNVGRLSRELADRCTTVYGVDITFGAALWARRAALGWPAPVSGYQLFREGVEQDWRSLSLPPRENVEIVLGSGLALPFRDGSFDIVAHAGTIEMTPAPVVFFQETLRALRPGGLLGQGSCYVWPMGSAIENWPGGCDGKVSQEWARAEFAKATELLAERRDVPWVLRYWDVSYMVAFAHILIGRKATSRALEKAD